VEPEHLPLPHLETFAKAAELGNFTRAARVLGLSQAAVSQRVQALEASLGTPLFRRHGGRVTLTDAGRTLHGYAQRVFDLLREARRAVTGQDAPVVGELTLASSSIPGEHFLPAVLAAFGPGHPHVQVRVTIGDSLAAIDQVERGRADLGLVGRKVEKPHLEYHLLARDRMVLVAPPGHPLAGGKSPTLAQLARHPLVIREAGSGVRHGFEAALERAGRSLADFRVALELGSNEAIKEAVVRGLGVAVLSSRAVEKEAAAGQLVARPIADLGADRELFLVQDRRRVLTLPARVFLNFLETSPLCAGGW